MEQSSAIHTERRAQPRHGAPRFIRLKQVMELCALSKTSVYEAMKKGEFPKAVKLGGRASAWVKSEVEDWIQQCIRASRQKP